MCRTAAIGEDPARFAGVSPYLGGTMKNLRNTLEKKLPLITLLLLVIQPALDVLSYFLGEMGSNALSTLLRFALLAAVALLGFILSDKKRLYFIFYGAAALFWIAHAANCFRVGYQSPVADAGNFLRILYFPIYTLSLITFFQKGEEVQKSVYLGFAVNLGEIIIFTALPWALGHPVYTYDFLGIGVLGWFGVPNAQSAIIVLVAPLALLWAYRTKKYPAFLCVMVLSFGLMFLTGTKLTFYSIFIIAGAFIFLFAINLKKKSMKYVLPLLAAAILVFAFRHQSPMDLRERMSDTVQGNYNSAVENSLENSGADEDLIRTIREGVDLAHTSEEKLEQIRRSLLGVYTDPEVYGSLFMNLYDRFGVYNVMDAYNYTSEPSVLSDTRVRKSTFSKLMWEEKDFATHLLGFEYSDVLMGATIYDLENDFPAVFYFCGYLGFGLYLLFFFYFAFLILRAFFRDVSHCSSLRSGKPGNFILKGFGSFWQGVRRFLTLEMGAVGMTFLLAIIAAQISGNVLRRPNVTVYFAAACACVYQLTVKGRKKRDEEEGF